MLLPQGLIGITQQPEGQGRHALAAHARVMPIQEGQRAVLLGVVERHTLFKVSAREGQVA
jgi:hypothetical protein